MKLRYFSLIFSTLGIILLYFLSTLSQPTIIELSEIPKYEGKQVIAIGVVTEYYWATYGSQIITIENDNTTVTVFVEGLTSLEYGDIIQVTGIVQKYRNDWEIVVDNERFVKIVRRWSNVTSPLWQLAENPSRYDGLNVNVTGFVDMVYDNYFYLVDQEETHSIIVFYTPSGQDILHPGQKVNVAAKFYFDEEDLRYKLVVSEDIHCITLLSEGG